MKHSGNSSCTCVECRLTAFVRLVREMRAAQRAYFRHRDGRSLARAKDAEQQVDAWLEEQANPQRGLFT